MEALQRTVVVTGSNGFIGSNLVKSLSHKGLWSIKTFTRANQPDDIFKLVASSRAIFHLAGVNRPLSQTEFQVGNVELTRNLCRALEAAYSADGVLRTLIYSSSVRSGENNSYGSSKKAALEIIKSCADTVPLRACIYNLPGVFGPGSKPFYNSVVATFCYSAVIGEPLQVDNPDYILKLAYIDDIIYSMIRQLDSKELGLFTIDDYTTNEISVKNLANLVKRRFTEKKLGSASPTISELEKKLDYTLDYFMNEMSVDKKSRSEL